MKYKVTVVAVGVIVILAVIFMGDGYLRTRRADQKSGALRTAVSAMSIQQLAKASEECDLAQAGGRVHHDAAYCAEVFRAIEDQPLQIVDTPGSPQK
jgi:hypothetical protein